MKRLLLASTVLALSGPVLGDHALAAPPSTFSWTGCYIGVNAGAGWNRNSFTDPVGGIFAPTGGSFDVNSNGKFVGGGQFGCDFQVAPGWFVGLQGDFSGANFSAQATDPFFAGKGGLPILGNAKTRWIASTQARVGFAWNDMLLYATGGPAWIRNEYSVENLAFVDGNFNFCANGVAIPCNPSGSETRVGWTLGFGLERAFWDRWTVGLVYNHYDFANRTVTLVDPAGIAGPATLLVNVKQQFDTVKVSLNYRFGWLGP